MCVVAPDQFRARTCADNLPATDVSLARCELFARPALHSRTNFLFPSKGIPPNSAAALHFLPDIPTPAPAPDNFACSVDIVRTAASSPALHADAAGCKFAGTLPAPRASPPSALVFRD